MNKIYNLLNRDYNKIELLAYKLYIIMKKTKSDRIVVYLPGLDRGYESRKGQLTERS
jgi:hypothetical protein